VSSLMRRTISSTDAFEEKDDALPAQVLDVLGPQDHAAARVDDVLVAPAYSSNHARLEIAEILPRVALGRSPEWSYRPVGRSRHRDRRREKPNAAAPSSRRCFSPCRDIRMSTQFNDCLASACETVPVMASIGAWRPVQRSKLNRRLVDANMPRRARCARRAARASRRSFVSRGV